MDIDISKRRYIKIEKIWYDVTNYKDHPGGEYYFKKFNLCDVSEDFVKIKGHLDGYVDELLTNYRVKSIPLTLVLNHMEKKDKPKNIHF
jgi:cytochrome b involved in lipid metabolism